MRTRREVGRSRGREERGVECPESREENGVKTKPQKEWSLAKETKTVEIWPS